MLQWKWKMKWKVTVKAKMYMRITEWKQSVKIREQKAWKSKRNGGKERMNPQEKAPRVLLPLDLFQLHAQ